MFVSKRSSLSREKFAIADWRGQKNLQSLIGGSELELQNFLR